MESRAEAELRAAWSASSRALLDMDPAAKRRAFAAMADEVRARLPRPQNPRPAG
jgi:hypothetical protein